MLPSKYQQIRGSEEELLRQWQNRNKNSSYSRKPNAVPWICSVICLLLLGVQLLYYTRLQRHGTYETGFATEFGELSVKGQIIIYLIILGPSISTINLVEVEFSGTLAYTETGHLYIDLGRDGVRYFGEPGPEVDQAWQALIGGKYTLDGKTDFKLIIAYQNI